MHSETYPLSTEFPLKRAGNEIMCRIYCRMVPRPQALEFDRSCNRCPSQVQGISSHFSINQWRDNASNLLTYTRFPPRHKRVGSLFAEFGSLRVPTIKCTQWYTG